MIVDAQIHLFDPVVAAERAERLGQHVLDVDEVLANMDSGGIDRAYLVPVGSKSNATCLQAAAQWPERFRVIGIPSLARPEFRDEVLTWQDRGFQGARVTFPPFREVSWLHDGTADWFWPVAEKLNLPLMVWAPTLFKELRDVAESHPNLRITVDHFNLYVEDKGAATVNAVVEQLLPLAELPNVAVKASTIPIHSDVAYPYPDMHSAIRDVVQAFGPSRVFWGTDLTHLPCSTDEAVRMFTEHLDFLDDASLELIMGKAILDWIGWAQ